MGFVAAIEYDKGKIGTTAAFQADVIHGIRWARSAALAGDNVDALIMSLMRHGHEVGHSSLALHRLGVPMEPEAAKP